MGTRQVTVLIAGILCRVSALERFPSISVLVGKLLMAALLFGSLACPLRESAGLLVAKSVGKHKIPASHLIARPKMVLSRRFYCLWFELMSFSGVRVCAAVLQVALMLHQTARV